MIVRNAARGGRRYALLTNAGTAVGVLAWGCFAAVGIAAIVATSATAFALVKLTGAAVLIVIGLRSAWGCGSREPVAIDEGAASGAAGHLAVRDGLIASLSNPKLAVFFVALFPQFVPRGAAVLPAALAMAALIVCFDLLWFSALALIVSRARRAFLVGPWARRIERLTGTVLIGLGIRLAFERR
jgi:threonine/homoserine/homoserine lactone efflux protein